MSSGMPCLRPSTIQKRSGSNVSSGESEFVSFLFRSTISTSSYWRGAITFDFVDQLNCSRAPLRYCRGKDITFVRRTLLHRRTWQRFSVLTIILMLNPLSNNTMESSARLLDIVETWLRWRNRCVWINQRKVSNRGIRVGAKVSLRTSY